MRLSPTAVLVTAFLAGAAAAEVGIRARAALERDRSVVEVSRGQQRAPVQPVRSTHPAPRRHPPGAAI